MQKKILIVLINNTSSQSCLDGLKEIEENLKDTYKVLLVDNINNAEDSLRMSQNDFTCICDYVNLPEIVDVGVILNKITPSLKKYDCEFIYFVFEDHKKIVSYLPVLSTMSEMSKDEVLGIKGGSVFSAFFYNFLFFQKNTKTEWLNFNGMLIPKNIWCDENFKLDLRYYKEFFQVDFGFRLLKRGYKLFKLKPYIFSESDGLGGYFRMRNPFLFMRINFGFNKYFLGIIYFLFQLPYAVIKFSKNKNYLMGVVDGMKLLYFNLPSSTS